MATASRQRGMILAVAVKSPRRGESTDSSAFPEAGDATVSGMKEVPCRSGRRFERGLQDCGDLRGRSGSRPVGPGHQDASEQRKEGVSEALQVKERSFRPVRRGEICHQAVEERRFLLEASCQVHRLFTSYDSFPQRPGERGKMLADETSEIFRPMPGRAGRLQPGSGLF